MMRRSRAPWLLALPVVAAHLWLSSLLLVDRLGWGAADRALARIEVAFVRELQPAAAPAQPVPLRRAPARAAPAASAPLATLQGAAPDLPPRPAQADPQPLARTPDPDLQASSAPASIASEAALAASAPDAVAQADAAPRAALPAHAAASSATAFEWPPSTRLSYTLTGNFRGPVEGQARVEWLLIGERYQVHLDVSVGPFFAPLLSRRLSSEGRITEQGLHPRHYDEETRVALRAPRRLSIVFEGERVRLPSGREVERPKGVQDSASQFVQMTWLFTMQPELLQPGRSVEFPLALPRHVEPWTYDVKGREVLNTPMGELHTLHVLPRRAPRPGDLVAEFWVAPTLQNLPVRILIRQDAETFVDLMLERLPQQAERR